jgi:hypothetical protein
MTGPFAFLPRFTPITFNRTSRKSLRVSVRFNRTNGEQKI